MAGSTFDKIVYLPSFNCEKHVGSVLQDLSQIRGAQDWRLLFVDNASTDNTIAAIEQSLRMLGLEDRATLVRCKRNLGYAGSQKFAYRLVRERCQNGAVVMLHADGQYPPEFVPAMFELLENEADVVYGVRSRRRFGEMEETPLTVRAAISVLNALESFLTGCSSIKEWHSGYVGYRAGFLSRLNLQAVTDTKHFDGNMLFAAHSLGASISSIPIYKRYKKYDGFVGPEAYLYIWHCLVLMAQMPKSKARLGAAEQTSWSLSADAETLLSGSEGLV